MLGALQGPRPPRQPVGVPTPAPPQSPRHAHRCACVSGNPPQPAKLWRNRPQTSPRVRRTLVSLLLLCHKETSRTVGLTCARVTHVYVCVTCLDAVPGTVPCPQGTRPSPPARPSRRQTLHLTPRAPFPLETPSLLLPKAPTGRTPALGCGPGTPGPCRSLASGSGPRTGTERRQVQSLPFRASTGEAAGRRVPGLCSSLCLGPFRGHCWAKAVRKTSPFPAAPSRRPPLTASATADHGPFARPPPGSAQGPALAAQRGGGPDGASQCFSSPCSRARTSERRSLRARNGRF